MNCCDEYGNCNQGRDCPVRRGLLPVVTHDANGATVTEWHAPQVDDSMPTIMFDGPHRWL